LTWRGPAYPFQLDCSTNDGKEFDAQEVDVVAVVVVVSVIIVVGGCTTLSSIVRVGGEPLFVSTQLYHLDS